MYKLIYPSKDTTLYSRHPSRNTGVDQILELVKVPSGSTVDDKIGQFEFWNVTMNSRILMDFDVSEISASIAAGQITNPKYYLTLKATEAIHLPIQYTIDAHPISGSWINGTGYYNNDFEVDNGASWVYRNGKASGVEWQNHGGDYYADEQYKSTQTFNYTFPDMRMDVTNIVRAWVSGSIPQHGMILKYSDQFETDSTDMGSLKFFAKDTHTIYIPRLEVFWDDVDVSGTGSISEIDSYEYVIYVKNMKPEYFEQEKPKLRIGVRERFPQRSYSVSNASLTTKRLPYNTYYQIMDSVTDEVIVPFNDIGTRVSCDSNGNYIRLDMDSMLPERYYKIIFKVVQDNGSTVNYHDNKLYFKLKRT